MGFWTSGVVTRWVVWPTGPLSTGLSSGGSMSALQHQNQDGDNNNSETQMKDWLTDSQHRATQEIIIWQFLKKESKSIINIGQHNWARSVGGSWLWSVVCRPGQCLALNNNMGRLRKQAEAGPEEGANSNKFPPRKRSIPYGFDFDLDEVWAPNNPHLKHLKNVGSSGEKNKTKIKPSSFSGSQVFFCGNIGLFGGV